MQVQEGLARDHGAAWSILRVTAAELRSRGVSKPEPQAVLLSMGGYVTDEDMETIRLLRAILPRRLPILVLHPKSDAGAADAALAADAFESYAHGALGVPGIGRRLRRTFEHWRSHLSHHMAEDASRAGREVAQFITDHTADAIIILDLEGKILHASPSVERMLGWTPAALAGQAATSIVHPDDQALIRLHHAQDRTSISEPITVSSRARTAGGAWLWVESISRSIPDAGGQPHQVVQATRDISGWRQMQGGRWQRRRSANAASSRPRPTSCERAMSEATGASSTRPRSMCMVVRRTS